MREKIVHDSQRHYTVYPYMMVFSGKAVMIGKGFSIYKILINCLKTGLDIADHLLPAGWQQVSPSSRKLAWNPVSLA